MLLFGGNYRVGVVLQRREEGVPGLRALRGVVQRLHASRHWVGGVGFFEAAVRDPRAGGEALVGVRASFPFRGCRIGDLVRR
jgi:hypothetical protein